MAFGDFVLSRMGHTNMHPDLVGILLVLLLIGSGIALLIGLLIDRRRRADRDEQEREAATTRQGRGAPKRQRANGPRRESWEQEWDHSRAGQQVAEHKAKKERATEHPARHAGRLPEHPVPKPGIGAKQEVAERAACTPKEKEQDATPKHVIENSKLPDRSDWQSRSPDHRGSMNQEHLSAQWRD
jgi:hypothetical protein